MISIISGFKVLLTTCTYGNFYQCPRAVDFNIENKVASFNFGYSLIGRQAPWQACRAYSANSLDALIWALSIWLWNTADLNFYAHGDSFSLWWRPGGISLIHPLVAILRYELEAAFNLFSWNFMCCVVHPSYVKIVNVNDARVVEAAQSYAAIAAW